MSISPLALLASLGLEQKVALLGGHDVWHTEALPGVPVMRCSDGPAGVRGTSWTGPASASFPCGTALGASFDPGLVEEVGVALGREARSKGAHVLLAPTVNLHRTPVGGRNFECISEDPTLTAKIAVGYVRGVQSQRVAACIKHFVANDTEFERMTISSEVDERTLRELYLVPFEAAVRPVDQGGANVRSMMTSYNKLNGTYTSEHTPLLRGVLRDEWGFDGALISDWFGTHSTAEALEASLDLEMPGPVRHRGDALVAAVRAGAVAESRVDESVRRVLELVAWCGLGDAAAGWTCDETTDDSVETRAIIRRAAIAGSVLLKNDGKVLPIGFSTKVALIGPNSEVGHIQGGGSARVRANQPSPLLETLRDRGLDVDHEIGCSISKRLPVLRGRFDVVYQGVGGATAKVVSDRVRFLWAEDPAPGVAKEAFGATISGSFVPDSTGEWRFGLTAVGAAVLRVNGVVVCDLSTAQTGGAFFGQGSPEIRGTAQIEAGIECRVEVDYDFMEYEMLRGVTVGAAAPEVGGGIRRAEVLAAVADVAIVVVGTNDDWETEGEDRETMDLPGDQDELVAAVAAANPNTVVLINAGSPVSMPWIDEVAAVMQVWFPGEEIGNAIADMVLGVSEPGGRLPVTIPKRLCDTPAYLSHPGDHGVARYAEGLFIGYRWYDARQIEPQFVFGHGLGYTTWTVGDSTTEGQLGAETALKVHVPVRNDGDRQGSTVVQCYVEPPTDGVRRPPRELRGFRKVTADAGASTTAEIVLTERDFSVWDVDLHGWIVPPGDYRVMVGESSRSLRQAALVTIA